MGRKALVESLRSKDQPLGRRARWPERAWGLPGREGRRQKEGLGIEGRAESLSGRAQGPAAERGPDNPGQLCIHRMPGDQ